LELLLELTSFSLKIPKHPITFVFGTGGRIRQSPRKIDLSALDHERVFGHGEQND
jgi:hypothetical protein